MALLWFQSCVLRKTMVLCVVVLVTLVNAVAERPLAQPSSGHGRALLQQTGGKVLTDYIGGLGGTMAFTDVPLDANVEYIFPLAFAIDADASGNTANGVFSSYWSSSLDAASAVAFQQANSNVRISVSLGGATQYVSVTRPSRDVNWYDPSDTDAWIANAVSSITSLASQFSITGIDIDYETFPTGSATFTACIGALITQLKDAGTISVASIAPFGSNLAEYTDLYQQYGTLIDYVNYQFYAEGLTSPAEYVRKFNEVSATFDASKLMASVNVDGTAEAGLTGTDFIDAVRQLPTYAGIMIWEADESKANGFTMEQLAAAQLSS